MMKLGYTLLYVSNVEATVSFYEKAFGLKRGFVEETGRYGEMVTGETKLGFVNLELAQSNGVHFQPASLKDRAPAFEIGFVTENVENAFKAAVTAGATEVAKPKQKPWGQTVAYVRDNNGFLVELCTSMGE